MSPFFYPRLVKKTKQKIILRYDAATQTVVIAFLAVWSGDATCGQRAVKAPGCYTSPLQGDWPKKVYWPIYIIYHLSFAYWCRRTVRQGISKFCWLTLSVLFYVGSAHQADGQSSSVSIISGT